MVGRIETICIQHGFHHSIEAELSGGCPAPNAVSLGRLRAIKSYEAQMHPDAVSVGRVRERLASPDEGHLTQDAFQILQTAELIEGPAWTLSSVEAQSSRPKLKAEGSCAQQLLACTMSRAQSKAMSAAGQGSSSELHAELHGALVCSGGCQS